MKLKPIALFLGMSVFLQANAGVVKTEGDDIIVSTKNGGLQLKTESGDFSFKVSGNLQWDIASYDDLYGQDTANIANPKDGLTSYIRRGEIKVSGKAYDLWKYGLKLKTNSDDSVDLDDATIGYTGFKPVEIAVGRWDMDFGLEDSTSSSWITGIERPFVFNMMNGAGGNDYGVKASSSAKNYTAQLALVNTGNSESNNASKDSIGYSFRGTYVPIMNDNMLLHLGLSIFDGNPDSVTVDGDTRLGIKKGQESTLFSSVSNVTSDREYAVEAAFQMQSFKLQGEYLQRNIKSGVANSDVKLNGYYGELSYMLGGGKRSYKKGSFSKPKGGKWEAFARYTAMNVDAQSAVSKGINGMDVDASSYTVGVNYFPTSNIRTSLNYVTGQLDNHVDIEGVTNAEDKGAAIVGRIQYVF
ncbi:OprO/OprP family phosphate-selective porin [Endozoicomonas sp.]|uniref:OprO/OprP family phosphate-selective porin n=1 Tax=Endozoicomonas sp. TaxID=1892382 RepID=UPI003AF721A3